MYKAISTWKMSYEAMKIVKKELLAKKSISDACVLAVMKIEDDQSINSVGYGGLPNRNGKVQLDSAYMDGNLNYGAVIEAGDIKNPILVARKLATCKLNNVLSGSGAVLYAKTNNFALRDNLTKDSYDKYLKDYNKKELEAYHDTVCFIGLKEEEMVTCVSTSGLFLKHPGRVGDSPIIGSGFYCDNEIGSCAATGIGEHIMRGCLSVKVVEKMKVMPVKEACILVLQEFVENCKRKKQEVKAISLIAMDKRGNFYAVTLEDYFPFVVLDDEIKLYYAKKDYTIHLADEKFLNDYQGD